jgi:hypothetical protein
VELRKSSSCSWLTRTPPVFFVVKRWQRNFPDSISRQLSALRVTVRFDLGAGDSGSAVRPAMPLIFLTLAGAVWLQLAQAVVEHKAFRACLSCRRWFELVPEVNRTSRHYCSEACRSRAYRSRKEKARELHGQGLSVARIAEQLGTTKQKVTAWLLQGEC